MQPQDHARFFCLGSLRANGTFRFYTSMPWRGYAQWVRAIRSYSSLCLLVETCLKTSGQASAHDFERHGFAPIWCSPKIFLSTTWSLELVMSICGPIGFLLSFISWGSNTSLSMVSNETLPGPIVMKCGQWHWWSEQPSTSKYYSKWRSRKYLLQIKFCM